MTKTKKTKKYNSKNKSKRKSLMRIKQSRGVKNTHRKRKYKRRRNKANQPVDRIFLGLVLILLVIGLIAILSAGVAVSQVKFGDPYHYFKHQFLYGVLPGVLLMLIVSRIPYKYWRKMAIPLFGLAIVLLVVVLISNAGLELKGAKRWINLGPVSFQPTEMVKLAVVVYLASWLSVRRDKIKDFTEGLIPFVIIMAIIGILIILQPDVGSLGAIAFISLGMFYLAGASFKHIIGLILIGLSGLFVLIKLEPYRMNRFLAFVNPEIDPQGIGWQVKQAAIAIGHGGIFGVGLGHSHQKFSYLPEVVGDSIFAIIAEEAGFIGAGIIVVLFLLLALRGFKLAQQAPDEFSAFLVAGVSLWIILQAMINIMAIIGLMPLTGITLPFISYGSTSLVFLLIGVGIVLNISRHCK